MSSFPVPSGSVLSLPRERFLRPLQTNIYDPLHVPASLLPSPPMNPSLITPIVLFWNPSLSHSPLALRVFPIARLPPLTLLIRFPLSRLRCLRSPRTEYFGQSIASCHSSERISLPLSRRLFLMVERFPETVMINVAGILGNHIAFSFFPFPPLSLH